MCRLHWCLCVSLGSLSQAALKHLLTSPLFPTWQFSQQLNCVHDYTLPASMALPSSQNGKEREPGKAGPWAGKGSAYRNNPAQMLTEQAGSQQHLREVTVLVDCSLSNSLITHPSCLSHALPVIHLFLPQYFQRRTKQSNSVWELLCQKTANGRSHPLPYFVQRFDFPSPRVLYLSLSKFIFSPLIKHCKNWCTMYYDNYNFIHWQMKVLESFPPN